MKIRKKVLFLVLALVFSFVFQVAAYGEENNISISPAFGGWENWVGSPNNPTPGAAPGVTQLLVGVMDSNGKFPSALENKELEYTLTFDWKEGDEPKSKTVVLKPATLEPVYNLLRFETVLGDGDNQFIPMKNQCYTLSLSVTDGDGNIYHGKSGDGAFCMSVLPVVNGVMDESYVYHVGEGNYPYTLNVSQYHSSTYTEDGVEYYKSDWETWNGAATLIMLVKKADIFSLGDLTPGTKVGLTFNDSEECITSIDSIVDMGDNILLRLPTQGKYTPTNGVIYDIGLTIYLSGNDGEFVGYTGWGENFTANGVPTVQTGDRSVLFIALAVGSVILMALTLKPKRRSLGEVSFVK